MKRVNVSNARSKDYADVLRKIVRDKVCPFCTEHFLTYHTKPIIKKTKHWILTENFKPYAGTKHHLLLVSKRHIEHFSELSGTAQKEMFALFDAELKKRRVRGGTLLMRFGDTDYTGASVGHLHAQLVSGVKRGKHTEPLLTAIGVKLKS
jgi:ATP adenylyltransferase